MGWLNQHLFLTILEAGKPKVKALTELMMVRAVLSGLQMAVFLYPHMTEQEEEAKTTAFL